MKNLKTKIRNWLLNGIRIYVIESFDSIEEGCLIPYTKIEGISLDIDRADKTLDTLRSLPHTGKSYRMRLFYL